ncbi:hypothetical protein [Corynebacterium aquatimens]|uniref:EcsC family protein n=1 Tax=Corynebacterium aquatimens TaxID=1190508 RepID=A0A931GXD7_9CORY|nr:hypothetical protein [Corynebacterium aquatimens]MBG6121304.1 hypothetical protein [Corynebacterium aquatimens]WJY66146.1 hypothetical protein CAQUA_07250 [Corynebacterium aquatimens]
MAFGRKKKSKEIVDAIGSDPAALEANATPLGKAFISALDRAVHMQSGVIKAYVNRLRRKNPEASPAEIQEMMDTLFLRAATGTGAGAGTAAAIPGIGFITGAAAIAGESLVFVDLAALYTVGSAYLRGVDITDEERRKAIVLVVLLGTQGSAIVDALVGPNAQKIPTRATLSRFSGPTLAQANNMLARTAMKSMNKKLRRMWIGKIMPLGIGAVAGTMANRKLANTVIKNVGTNLGAVPGEFPEPLPAETAEEKELDDAVTKDSKDGMGFTRVISFFRNARK